MMPAFVTGAAVVASIIGTLVLAAGFVWALGLFASRRRRDHYDDLDRMFK
jgi:hypothetical protein